MSKTVHRELAVEIYTAELTSTQYITIQYVVWLDDANLLNLYLLLL